MKFTKFLAVVLAVVSFNAFALLNATEVGALLDSGQAVAAEKAIKEVLATRDTPKLHYMLAQAYHKQGRTGEAVNELNRATAMDPSHSFASGDAKFREISASILGVKVAYAEKPKEAVVSSGPSVGTVILYLITFVGGALLIGMGIMAFKRKREREAEESRLSEKLEAAQHEVALLMQEVESKILQEKTSAVVNTKRLDALETLKNDVLRLYEDAKATDNVEYEIDRIGNRRRDLSSTLRSVMLKSYSDTTVHSNEPTPKVKVSRPTPTPKRTEQPKRRELETVSAPAPTHTTTTQAPSTVIVQQDNSLNNALTTAILINELDHSHHHDHDYGSRDYDSGRSSSWDSTPSRSDSGRSSSWDSTPSLSDSGSSSSWGSSSSDDDSSKSSYSSWSSSSSDSGSSSSWDSGSSSSSDSGSSSDW